MAEDYLLKLIRKGTISADQLAEAEAIAKKQRIGVDDALIRLGYLTASEVSQLQASQFGYEMVNLDNIEIPTSVIALIPESVARESSVIPIGLRDERIQVAMANANDL
ncbi:MAG TPA: type II/IV secretion system protein, partial [Planctomycetaceae bacterium]|nr:type II/IV secretion system protein [Planctomycetaceae bacterium]